MEEVVLVDHLDNELGVEEKLLAHQKGKLHRALSVFLFNSKGEMLIQQRAAEKYHSANLWSNACCSHPRPQETTEDAASRRLSEELGINTKLEWLLSFQYKVAFDNGLIEHELDHIYIGTTDELPQPNPDEVSAVKYIGTEELKKDVIQYPEHYTFWFRELIHEVLEKVENKKK